MSFDANFSDVDREIRFHAQADRLGPGRIVAERIIADIRRRYRLGKDKLSKRYSEPGLTRREIGVAQRIVCNTYPGFEFFDIEYDETRPDRARVIMLW